MRRVFRKEKHEESGEEGGEGLDNDMWLAAF